MISPIEAKLLVSFVHFLHFLRAQHVLHSLFIDGPNELWIWAACVGLFTSAEAKNSRQEHS